jgi:hypothetical protein
MVMKLLSLLAVTLCLALLSAAFARGGMGSHMSMGGALGSSAAAPGTNSLGTALPSSEGGGRATKGPLLGTSPATDKDDARLEKMLEGSICRGC